MDLSGRVVLVTGGAGGLGSAALHAFARAGVGGAVIAYRTGREEAARLAADLEQAGTRALAVPVDVRDDDSARRMIAEVDRAFGRLDVLVNNAGITKWIPIRDLESVTDEVWAEVLDVNLTGAFRCTRAAAPLLRTAGGMVVNVASISGVLAPPTLSSIPYGASKAALIHLTRSLAVALAPEVRVNAVAPAVVDTRWMREHYGAGFAGVAEDLARSFPLRRIGDPQDIGAAILGLVTGGDFVTGQTLLIDGGLSVV